MLVGRNSPESIKLFTRALEKAPNFPWPHLAFVTIYASPNFLDKEKARTHMKAFLAVCPTSFEAYEQLTRIDDRDLNAQGAAKLRPILQGRNDAEAIGAYSSLWSLEFKARATRHPWCNSPAGERLIIHDDGMLCYTPDLLRRSNERNLLGAGTIYFEVVGKI